jgi:hypothetical protein
MRFFFDTEFSERQGTMVLISIGIVAEDGRELYAVSSDFDPAQVNDWVAANVLPKLPPRETWIPVAEIARRIQEFVGEAPEFWAYYADYDWVLLCWCFGAMIDLPDTWPMFCLDLRQSMQERDVARAQLPAQDKATSHDALADARWVRDAWTVVYGCQEPGVSASA